MKKYFWIDCYSAIDTVFWPENTSSLSVFGQLQVKLHILLCPQCHKEIKRLQYLGEIMRTDFFPAAPDFEGIVMDRLYKEVCLEESYEKTCMEEKTAAAASFSIRGWALIGSFVLLSLTSSFFGMNFGEIAATEGSSFLLPVGLTIGMVLTCYGAFFIASHLKELSERFLR